MLQATCTKKQSPKPQQHTGFGQTHLRPHTQKPTTHFRYLKIGTIQMAFTLVGGDLIYTFIDK